jgi:hypothetical protein
MFLRFNKTILVNFNNSNFLYNNIIHQLAAILKLVSTSQVNKLKPTPSRGGLGG